MRYLVVIIIILPRKLNSSSLFFFYDSIIQKANNALEVLKEVLDAVDAQNPEVWVIFPCLLASWLMYFITLRCMYEILNWDMSF